jgi:nucleotide-binding universal stress UspA family protein
MHVLLAIDESVYSEAALTEVAKRRWDPDTHVRVLSVIPVPFARPTGSPGMAMAMAPGSPNWPLGMLETRNQLMDAATKLVERAAARVASTGAQVDTRIREGDARIEIVDEAAEWHANLIVVGSHGYTGMNRLMLGSVAHSVVNHAPCSVQIVRLRDA